MYRGIMLVPRERHKMKQRADKAIDHQRHFVHFLWTSNRGQQVYDMRIFFLKNLSSEKKNPEFWKHLSFFLKKSELKKTWGLKKSEFFKKINVKRKNLGFNKGKYCRYENKTANLK